MRRFVTLSALLLFAIPFGVSVSGCSKKEPVVYCNTGDSGSVAGQLSTITLGPITSGISLNYSQINTVSQPSGTDCKGQSAYSGAFTYGTTDMTIADVQPTTGRVCGGTWNRNSGGGIPDYTVCNPTNKTGTAYISASAQGVTSNPLPIFVHPVVTSVVFGTDSQGSNSSPVPTASITAYSIHANTPTFLGANTFTAGQVVSLYSFPTSTFFNGIANAVVQSAGLSSTQFILAIPGFTHPDTAATLETGYAGAQDCTTNPTTSCCPLAYIGSASATPYIPTSCISQGQTRQLAARVYAGTAANPVNISCQVGPLVYQAESPASGTQVSPVVSIDSNGVATANQPGSVLITAYIANAASSAGFFSTCPPLSITLTAPGTSGSPIIVNQNNTQPLIATAIDTQGNPITGLDLEYESTAPTTVPTALASITPQLAGAASITAVCRPPVCNPSAYNQIGLFGNGKPVTSNPVDVVAPGTNSTVLFMASTQSKYMTSRDFTRSSISAALLLPYAPNSMVINNSGSTLYMGSTTALMTVTTSGSLSVASVDLNSPGTVLAVSPDNSQVVLSDPIKHIISIEDTASGRVITTYGGIGTHAQFTPDSQTLYIAAGDQVLVYSTFTGWTNINSTTLGVMQVNDVAITVPGVGAYFAGPNTTAVNYCAISTPGTPGNETNVFYPKADSSSATTDRIAATNDGKHILGATITSTPTLNDLRVQVPISGAGVSIACPLNGTLAFSNSVTPTPLTPITASAITGVLPTSDSSEAFVTYTGSGSVIPAYAPAATGPGAIQYIPLSGTAIAPIAGVVSADNNTFYAGTTGDNLVHIINRATLTDSSTLTPALIGLNGAIVPVDLLAQRPRTPN